MGASMMETETIALSPSDSIRRFNVHKGILENTCRIVYQACTSFKEGEDGIYKFEDVSEGTLSRFVQWAYKSTYEEEVEVTKSAEQLDNSKSENPGEGDKDNDIDENHPLLVHGRLYVFGDKYLIKGLKTLALQKIRAKLRNWGQVSDLSRLTSIIELLDLMSTNLPSDDEMLDFLGKYSAYNLMNLRQQQCFNDVTGELGPHILRYVNPWNGDPFQKGDGTYD